MATVTKMIQDSKNHNITQSFRSSMLPQFTLRYDLIDGGQLPHFCKNGVVIGEKKKNVSKISLNFFMQLEILHCNGGKLRYLTPLPIYRIPLKIILSSRPFRENFCMCVCMTGVISCRGNFYPRAIVIWIDYLEAK